MIRYALACETGHEFESWFPSASSYDAQVAGGLVACPVCGSGAVEKRLMAPALATSKRSKAQDADRQTEHQNASEPEAAPAGMPAVTPMPQMALMSEREVALRGMLRAMREHVVKTADYVGPDFAGEARKMHYGEIEHRSIYGEANHAEARELLDEGIEVHPLPMNPDDRN